MKEEIIKLIEAMIKRAQFEKKDVSEVQKGYASVTKRKLIDALRYLLKQVKGID